MRPKGNFHYSVHRDFRLFCMTPADKAGQNTLVNPRGYFQRWVASYNFLFNLFFVESFVQLMGNKLFLEETLVFNWHYSFKDYKIFRFVQPFLMFSDMPHGEFVHDVLTTLLDQQLDFMIIIDLQTHRKLLRYLKNYHVFMIGLTPINYSPWTVSYPIPTFADSHLSQFLFLKFILKLYSHAKSCSHKNKLKTLTH